MAIQTLFPTLISRVHSVWTDAADECQALAATDAAGHRWSARHYLGGYTSYGSLDRLHLVSSFRAELRRRIDPHCQSAGQDLALRPARPQLDMTIAGSTSCRPARCTRPPSSHVVHQRHLLCRSAARGGGAEIEDPRFFTQMADTAAPRRRPSTFPLFRQRQGAAGDMILFESWLRHEVPAARFEGERVSISFTMAGKETPMKCMVAGLLRYLGCSRRSRRVARSSRGAGWVVFSGDHMIAFQAERRHRGGRSFRLAGECLHAK